MSRWFRHYAGMMRDEKLVRVAIRSKQPIERVLWIWGAILESAAEIDDGGRYDLDAAEVAYFLRADQADVDAVFIALADAGRVDAGAVVKWGDRQFSSDRSKERVAAHRERKRAEKAGGNDQSDTGNDDVTLQERHGNSPETETETELDTERKNPPTPQGGGAGEYAFQAKVVRLKRADYDDWRKRFSGVADFDAELYTLDDWLSIQTEAKQKQWFGTGASWLSRRHQEAMANRQRAGPMAVVGL